MAEAQQTHNRKPAAAVAVAAFVTIAAWVSKAYGGVEVPGEIQGAVTTVGVFFAVRLMPEGWK